MNQMFMMNQIFDAARFRNVLGHYPTGVCVITAVDTSGRAVGMTVGSFTSVSLDPPLVAFLPDKSSMTWPKIVEAGGFCVNILSARQGDVCKAFASRASDKFAGLVHRSSPAGRPILDEVVGWIDCRISVVHEAGDHYIAIGEVEALDVEKPEAPLLFFNGSFGSYSPLESA
jgi:3-hydroxy-9,10-secoandrosta-1,3,5(10)-triene-9,17-dione monooxygenase reductase component